MFIEGLPAMFTGNQEKVMFRELFTKSLDYRWVMYRFPEGDMAHPCRIWGECEFHSSITRS